MDDPTNRLLSDRLSALEARVVALEDELRALGAPAVRRIPLAIAAPSLPSASTSQPATENLLNRAGTVLLLIGLAFLFNYAADRGWFPPRARLVFGAGLGVALAAFGAWLHGRRVRADGSAAPERRALAQWLIGGGVVALYATIYAAVALYDLLPSGGAYGLCAATTAIGGLLASRAQAEPVAMIATTGALVAPVILSKGGVWLPGAVIWTQLVMLGATALGRHHRWVKLLWVSGFGSLALLTTASSTATETIRLAAVGVTWFATAFAVAGTATLHLSITLGALAVGAWGLHKGSPLLAGGVIGAAGLLEAAVSAYDRPTSRLPSRALETTAGALLLLTVAAFYLFDGALGPLVVGGLGLGALVLGIAGAEPQLAGATRALGALVLAVAAAALVFLLERGARPPFTNGPALVSFALLTAAGALAVLSALPAWERRAFGASLWVALLVLLGHEFVAAGRAGAALTLTWGALGLLVLVPGLARDSGLLRSLGYGTLVLVIGKLTSMDLANVDAIWRILLFMGFGGAFLGVSFWFGGTRR